MDQRVVTAVFFDLKVCSNKFPLFEVFTCIGSRYGVINDTPGPLFEKSLLRAQLKLYVKAWVRASPDVG